MLKNTIIYSYFYFIYLLIYLSIHLFILLGGGGGVQTFSNYLSYMVSILVTINLVDSIVFNKIVCNIVDILTQWHRDAIFNYIYLNIDEKYHWNSFL